MPFYEVVGHQKGGNLPLPKESALYEEWRNAHEDEHGVLRPVRDLAAECYSASGMRRGENSTGYGAGSCCAYIEYLDDDGVLHHDWGSSRMKMYYNGEFYKTTTGKLRDHGSAHAEICCLVQHIDTLAQYTKFDRSDVDDTTVEMDFGNRITRLYIELSPCPNCGKILKPYVEQSLIMYSYKYGDDADMRNWRSANRDQQKYFREWLKIERDRLNSNNDNNV
jgi:hypothetical protein